MSLALLAMLQEKLGEQIAFVTQLTAQVESEGRDLVDAEETQLAAARDRIGQLNRQITPLKEMDETISHAGDAVAALAAARNTTRPAGGGTRSLSGGPAQHEYASVGAYIVDHLRAKGNPHQNMAPDPAAVQRIQSARVQALTNQTTADTPGILPTPIVGQVMSLLDASRPLLTSLGVRAMDGIPGTSFTRPKVLQHTQSGKQSAEKAELVSRQMKINPIAFLKETHGGWVNISRQDMDWSSPAAWDILVTDLADAYAIDTETVVAAAFALVPPVASNVVRVDNTLQGWATALYGAAVNVYKGCKRLPDRIWCSTDVWGEMGSVVDAARLAFPPTDSGNAGSSDLTRFSGNVFQLPRIVVPELPADTCILGASPMYEVYEERIGLLSAVEPSVLGVQVAYGGYIAFGAMEAAGFAAVKPPPAP